MGLRGRVGAKWLMVAASTVLGVGLVLPTAASATDLPQPPDLGLRPDTRVTLPNGLTVILDEDRRAPVVSLQIRYDVGTRDEPASQPGIASLTARMLAQRTAHVPDRMYDTYLARAGASPHGWQVYVDSTAFWATVPSSALQTVLWLWSDQMGFFAPTVDQAFVDEQRLAVLHDHRERVENSPLGALRAIELEALYPEGHPYRRSSFSVPTAGLKAEEVVRFYDAHYAPNDAVLVLSGDVGTSTLDVVQKYFGAIPKGPESTLAAPAAELHGEVEVDVAANFGAPVVSLLWPTPALFEPDDGRLDILARLLTGSHTALLVWELVDKRKVAAQVLAHQNSGRLGSDFEIRAIVAAGHTPAEVVAAVDDVLAEAGAKPLGSDRVGEASLDYVLPVMLGLEDPAYRAGRAAGYAMVHRDAPMLLIDVANHFAATPESIQRTVRQWLPRDRRVRVVVTPDPRAPSQGVVRHPHVTTGGGE